MTYIFSSIIDDAPELTDVPAAIDWSDDGLNWSNAIAAEAAAHAAWAAELAREILTTPPADRPTVLASYAHDLADLPKWLEWRAQAGAAGLSTDELDLLEAEAADLAEAALDPAGAALTLAGADQDQEEAPQDEEEADPVDALVSRLLTDAPRPADLDELRSMDEATLESVMATLAAGGVDARRLSRWLRIDNPAALELIMRAELTAEEIVTSGLLADPSAFADNHPLMIRLMDMFDQSAGLHFYEAVRDLRHYAPADSEEQVEAMITAVRAASARRKHGLVRWDQARAEAEAAEGAAEAAEGAAEGAEGAAQAEEVEAGVVEPEEPSEEEGGFSFSVLGIENDCVIISHPLHGLVALTAAKINENNLIRLGWLSLWAMTFPKDSGSRPDWSAAADWLWRKAERKGRVNIAGRLRGPGVYLDGPQNSLVVVNTGRDQLVLDPEAQDFVDVGGAVGGETYRLKHVYVPVPGGGIVEFDQRWYNPLTEDEGQRFIEMLSQSALARAEEAALLAAIAAGGTIAGALPYRVPAWLCAPGGTGKTTLLGLLRRALGETALSLEGASVTEAGIRRSIGQSSRVLLMNEAEPGGTRDKAMANIMNYVRSSFDGGMDVKIIDGGPKYTSLNSVCIFASIQHLAVGTADARRWAMFDMRQYDVREAMERMRRMNETANALLDDDFPTRLTARMALNTRRIADDQERLLYMLGEQGADREILQSASTVLSVLWSLTNDRPMSDEDAAGLIRQWLAPLGNVFRFKTAERDEDRVLNLLRQLRIHNIKDVNGQLMSANLASLVQAAVGVDNDACALVSRHEARKILAEWGIEILRDGTGRPSVAIATGAKDIERYMQQNGVAGDWMTYLSRADGVTTPRVVDPSGKEIVHKRKFKALGGSFRYRVIDITLFVDEEDWREVERLPEAMNTLWRELPARLDTLTAPVAPNVPPGGGDSAGAALLH